MRKRRRKRRRKKRHWKDSHHSLDNLSLLHFHLLKIVVMDYYVSVINFPMNQSQKLMVASNVSKMDTFSQIF
jgi:hypothetical protein